MLLLRCSLSDLQDFVSATQAGLSQRVEEGDYGGLVGVMGHLLAVKEKQATADAMFEPLQQTIALLMVYEQELPDVEEHGVDLHQQRQDSEAHVEAGADGQAETGNDLAGGGGTTGYE